MAITTPIAYWKLDESSGNASDSVGGYTLTNNNSVAYAAGKINNGADFGTSGTTKSLSSVNTTLCRGSNSFTFNTWFKLAQQPSGSQQNVFSIRGQSSSGKRQVNLDYRDSGGYGWNLWTGSTGGTETKYNITETIGTWVMITCIYDSATGNLTSYRNGVLMSTLGTGGADAGSDIFKIGNEAGDNRQVFGMQDECGFWNVALTVDEILKIYNAGRGNGYPFTDNTETSIESYWKMDESSGNAADSVASNTATNVGTVVYSSGKINNGADLNGSSQYFTFPTMPKLGSGPWSVNAWVKTSASGSIKEFLFWGTGTTGNGIDIYMSAANKLTANFFGGGGIATSTTSINTNAWVMCTITYDGTNIKVYVNGTLENTGASYSGNLTGSTGVIGANDGVGNNWTGSLDEIGIWSRTLTSTEITALYRSGNGIQYPFILTQILNATSAITSTLIKEMAKTLTVTSTNTASIIKQMAKTLSVTATHTGQVWKELARTLSVTTTVSAAMEATRVFLQTLSATVTNTATMDKLIGKALTVTSTVTSTISKSRLVTLDVATAITSDMSRLVGKTLTVTLSIAARVSAPFWKSKYPPHGDEEDYNIKYNHD